MKWLTLPVTSSSPWISAVAAIRISASIFGLPPVAPSAHRSAAQSSTSAVTGWIVIALHNCSNAASLAVAFLKPVEAGREGLLANAIKALEDERERLDRAYGDGDPNAVAMNTLTGRGSLADILAYAKGGLADG